MDTFAPTFIIEIDGRGMGEDITQHVESFSYEDHEDKMDELRVSIADLAMSYVDHPQLQEGCKIRVRWGYLGNMGAARQCTIKEIGYKFQDDGTVRLSVVAFDSRHKLTGRAMRRCWKDKTDKQVVEDIAADCGLGVGEIELPGDSVREFVSQGGKTGYEYISEIAEDHGCNMWVENESLYVKPVTAGDPVMTLRYREERDGYLISFSATTKAEEGKGTHRETESAGIDPLTKKPYKGTGNARGITVNLGSDREKQEPNIGGDNTGRSIPSPDPRGGMAQTRAQGKATKHAGKAVEGTARTIGIPSLKAKDSVILENVGAKFSGKWRVKSVRHSIGSGGYVCDLKLARVDHNNSGGGGGGVSAGSPPKTQGGNAPNGITVNLK